MDPEAQAVTASLARRGFVMTSLITGFTLAATKVDAQVIHTDTAGIEAGDTKIPVSDGELPAYYARPDGNGPFPIIMVVEEIFGVHEHIKDLCRRLAKVGYLAVAPELYARIADLSKMSDPEQIIRDVISKAPDATVLSDLDATAAWAGKHRGDPARLGITGFCRGGRDVWLYDAHNPALKAAVAWYGPVGGKPSAIQPRNAGDVATELKAPLLGMYGGKDTSIPEADVRAAMAKAKESGKTVDLIVFPNSAHGFNADYRPSYNPDDAKAGWARMLAWFKQHGVA